MSIKEQELQELSNQIAELKAAQSPAMSALRNSLLDPAVNIVIQNLKKELETTKKKMQETQDELSAWKFTPDSVTGAGTTFVYISHSALCLLLKFLNGFFLHFLKFQINCFLYSKSFQVND